MAAHALSSIVATLLAGWLMLYAGLGKRKLAWRKRRRR